MYLGLSQVEMTGSSVFDYTHQQDHEELAKQLGKWAERLKILEALLKCCSDEHNQLTAFIRSVNFVLRVHHQAFHIPH
jgi:hypothetical protein